MIQVYAAEQDRVLDIRDSIWREGYTVVVRRRGGEDELPVRCHKLKVLNR
jgi:hypothetical protein